MEITKENFVESLPQIKESIKNADFIAIDCELTGLNDGMKVINKFETPKECYERVRSSSMNFSIIQYGVCTFRYDDELKGFKYQVYNFYIFPTIKNRYTPDNKFLCQTSSINFLISHGFDFNKTFKNGIPYLNYSEAEAYKKKLIDNQNSRKNSQNQSSNPVNLKSLSPAERKIVDNIFEEIEQFILSGEEEKELSKCNAYIRKVIYYLANKKLENRASLESRESDTYSKFFVTKWKSPEQKIEDEKRRVQQEEEEFQRCVGFSEVVKCIVESEKLIVGHNILLDFLHTIDKFLEKLPMDYEEFKNMSNVLFSKVLDTKYMSSIPPFNEYVYSTALPKLLETVQKKPFQIPPIEVEENGKGYGINCNKEHEAGYDAYITGLCFLAMWNSLGSGNNSNQFLKDFSLLKVYQNRLFLMQLFESPYIHLGGTDPYISRDNVLYLKFPMDWKKSNIEQLFQNYSTVEGISWIDDQSAFVSLYQRDKIESAVRDLSKRKECQVVTYSYYQAQLNSKNQSQLKRKISGTEHSFKKRKTEVVEDDIKVDTASINTYASVLAKTPKLSPKTISPVAVQARTSESQNRTPESQNLTQEVQIRTSEFQSRTPVVQSNTPVVSSSTPKNKRSAAKKTKKKGKGEQLFSEGNDWD